MPSVATPRHVAKATKTSTNVPKLTILPVTSNLRLAADAHAWMIQKCKRRKDRRDGIITDEWKASSWHPTLDGAVNALVGYQLRTSGVQTVAEALAEVERISATLIRALSPRFEVREVA